MRSLAPGRVISRRDALAAGWTDPALRRAVNSGRIHRLRDGYFSSSPPDALLLAIAAALACPGATLSHRSAALIDNIPLLGAPIRRPELTVPPASRGSLAGAHLHRATLGPDDVRTVGRISVTTPAHTVVDLARQRGVTAGVVAADFVLHEGLATEDDISRVVVKCWNWPGIRRAGIASRLVDSRSESPLESVSRLKIHRFDVPPPEPQQIILDQYGYFVARVDFGWAKWGVVGEADGRLKYTEMDKVTAEKDRQEQLERLGLVVVRWGWDEAVYRPRRLAARLTWAFDRAATLARSGSPQNWSVADS